MLDENVPSVVLPTSQLSSPDTMDAPPVALTPVAFARESWGSDTYAGLPAPCVVDRVSPRRRAPTRADGARMRG